MTRVCKQLNCPKRIYLKAKHGESIDYLCTNCGHHFHIAHPESTRWKRFVYLYKTLTFSLFGILSILALSHVYIAIRNYFQPTYAYVLASNLKCHKESIGEEHNTIIHSEDFGTKVRIMEDNPRETRVYVRTPQNLECYMDRKYLLTKQEFDLLSHNLILFNRNENSWLPKEGNNKRVFIDSLNIELALDKWFLCSNDQKSILETDLSQGLPLDMACVLCRDIDESRRLLVFQGQKEYYESSILVLDTIMRGPIYLELQNRFNNKPKITANFPSRNYQNFEVFFNQNTLIIK